MAINVKPLGDRVLVQSLEGKEVKIGRHHHSRHGEREASRGDGRSRRYRQARRQWQEDRVQRQSRRLSPHLEITEIKIDGENYLIVRVDDILGITG
jgi:co-chaperonin GroES (HSP10)